MSISQGENFRSTLANALREAGLPEDPTRVVGRVYRLCCEFGSHDIVLSGRITRVVVADEGGLELYVTNRQFQGMTLESIMYDNGAWIAHTKDSSESGFFEGEFELLD